MTDLLRCLQGGCSEEGRGPVLALTKGFSSGRLRSLWPVRLLLAVCVVRVADPGGSSPSPERGGRPCLYLQHLWHPGESVWPLRGPHERTAAQLTRVFVKANPQVCFSRGRCFTLMVQNSLILFSKRKKTPNSVF